MSGAQSCDQIENMKKCVFVILFFLIGCATPNPAHQNGWNFTSALEYFNKVFPVAWPPKPLNSPLSSEQLQALSRITEAVDQALTKSGVNYKRIDRYKVVVTPTGETPLNQYAKQLENSGTALEYDALYFAANPFSMGSFQSQTNILLFSHAALKDDQTIRDLIEHELVHVKTNQDLKNKVYSVFYCKFKGQQFEPFYLACDEMKAYNSDLKRLLARNADSQAIKSKAKPAKMHTEPIESLINGLKVSAFKVDDGNILVPGQNAEGEYIMEFPRFVLGKSKKVTQKQVEDHLRSVRAEAKKLAAEIPTL